MRKIYRYLIAAAVAAAFALTLGACEAPHVESEQENTVVAGSYDSPMYAKKTHIGEHEYYIVYATCDGGPDHWVRECTKNHCFLRHSPDCPCHKTEPSASLADDAEDTESTDPFDW